MLQISPEELFFLGKQMKATYIDYDYISMMKDIQQQYTLREKEIMDGLVKRGVLAEDFSGETELDEEARSMLEPLFFGKVASEILFLADRNGESPERYKFHFWNGRVVSVRLSEDCLLLAPDGAGELEKLKGLVIPETYQGKTGQIALGTIDPDQAECVLVLKNITIGKEAAISQFVRLDGVWYVGKDEKFAESLTKEEMERRWNQMTKGE